jgi:hypothetical protein
MKKLLRQPIKVLDGFLESAAVWRHFALKQDFATDENLSWPGTRTKTIDELNPTAFHTLAGKLIQHIHGRTHFRHLKTNFALVDKSFNMGWIHRDESFYNVAGVIFLNPEPPKNSGLTIFTQINETKDYTKMFVEEIQADPADRHQFLKYKQEQRASFKQNMYIENMYNRCVMFSPEHWHSAQEYFGDSPDTARLTITFFGTAE